MAYEWIVEKEETSKCLLCAGGPCSKACPHNVKPDRIIRALRFENPQGAARLKTQDNPCAKCTHRECEKACTRGRIDGPVRICDVINNIDVDLPEEKDVNLSVDFCGVKCENPFFLSSSIVGSNYEMVAKAFDMGWAGVAFKTIGFFVPKEVSPRFDRLEKENNPFIGFKNIEQISDHTLDENLQYLKDLKKNYPTKIIIASIMGRDEEEWTVLAKAVTKAGADIVECNFSCPHMSGEGLGSDVGTNPELVRKYTEATRKGTHLPILAKMTPNITNMELPAIAAVQSGATGIAAINTIKSIMNINPVTFSSGPDVTGKTAVGGYSGKAVKPIALRFIYDMKSNSRLKDIPISGMGGIETWKDALEFMLLGCATVQVTTSVMQYGYRIIDDLISGIKEYMRTNNLVSIEEIFGKALPNIISAEELDRNTVEYPKFNREECVACGRCYLSCYDAGHQALRLGVDGKPVMDAHKCVGCQLCKIVCPVNAVTKGIRV